jgi:hypothetical protein
MKEKMRALVEEILSPPAEMPENLAFSRNYELAWGKLAPLIAEFSPVYFEVLQELKLRRNFSRHSGKGCCYYFPLSVAVEKIPAWRAEFLARMLLWPEVYARADYSVLSQLVERLVGIGNPCAIEYLQRCKDLIIYEDPFATDEDGRLRLGARRMINKIRLAIGRCNGNRVK